MAKGLGTVGFLGFGNMGSAIASGLIARGVLAPEAVMAHDPDAGRAAQAAALGARLAGTAAELASAADTLVMAVKPQMWREAAAPMAGALKPGARVVSIMAGVSIASLRSALGEEARVIRVMPNLAVSVSLGMSGFCGGSQTRLRDMKLAAKLLGSTGKALELPEAQLDAVTALSGSGPAFLSYVLQAMIDGGVALGLTADTATELALQTMLGTATVLSTGSVGVADFIKSVTSAKGTTAEGLAVLEKSTVRSTLKRTLAAAARRSRELSKLP